MIRPFNLLPGAVFGFSLLTSPLTPTAREEESPSTTQKLAGKGYHVLFIAIDDLNDLVGCLGGNPEAITPQFGSFGKTAGDGDDQSLLPLYGLLPIPKKQAAVECSTAKQTGPTMLVKNEARDDTFVHLIEVERI